MDRSPSSGRWPLEFIAVVLLTLFGVLGCGKRQDSLSGIGAGNLPPGKVDDPCASHQTGCACDQEGQTTACGSVKEKVDGYVICSEGVRTCTSGQWGDCVADHEEKKPLSFVAPMQGGYTAQALGASTTCNDLCDPGCQSYTDDANDLSVDPDLTAGPNGVSLPAGAGGGTCSGLALTPATATVTVTAINADGTIVAMPNSGKVDFDATCSGGTPIEPSWTIDSYDRAVISAHGVVTVYSGRGGPIQVTGSTSGGTANATLTVQVQVGDTPITAGTTTEPGKTLYPYNDTVFPLGLKAPLVQWTEGGISPTKTQVMLCYPQNTCTTFQYAKTYPTSTAPSVTEPRDGPLDSTVPAWQIPQEIWSAFDQTTAGDVGQIIIRRQVNSTKYKQLAINVRFATDALRGTVYYTQYQRALHTTSSGQTFTYSGSTYVPGQTCEVGNSTHPSSTAGSQTRAIDLSTSAATNIDPFAKGGYAAGCPVCHSVSADGSTAVSGGQNWQKSGAPSPLPTGYSNSVGVDKIGLDSTGAPMFTGLFQAPNYSNTSATETSNEDSRGFSYAAISPDGSLVLQAPFFWGSTQSTPSANNTQNGDVNGISGGRKLYFFADTNAPNPGFAVQFATTGALPTYSGACSGSGSSYSCTLTASSGTLTVDGQSMNSTSYSVLVKDETGGNAKYNGVYSVSSTSPWRLTLRSDATSTTSFLPQTEVRVTDGVANRGNVYYVASPTGGTITPGATPLTFSQRIYPTMALGGTLHTADYATTTALSPATVTQSGNVLTAGAPGYLNVDGHILQLGEVLLVKDQANGAQNGIYKMTTFGGAGSGTATSASYATTTALPANSNSSGVLTASANGALPSIDTVAPAVGDTVLVKNEGNQANNGIYTVTALGAAGTGTPLATTVCATTAALPANTNSAGVLTGSNFGALGTLDSCTLVVGSRVLVKNETTAANNGVYTVTALGAGGTAAHTAARVGTVGALPANTSASGVLTGTSWGALPAIDGVTVLAGDRVLVMNEATQANNGIYTVTSPGTGTSTVRGAVTEATTAALPANTNTLGVLTATNYGGLVVDGIAVSPGDRVLVMNEATQANNGIYTVTATGGGIGTAHTAARVATAGALPANTNASGVLTASAFGVLPPLDGVTLAVNDRVLVKNETAQANNGIYTVTNLGTGTGASHTAVRAATTASLSPDTATTTTITETGWGALSIDGVAMAAGDRVLVKNEVTQPTNGIYVVTNAGTGTANTHTAVVAATTGALPANTASGGTLTATNPGPLGNIDGYAVAQNDRVLVKNEATGANNGIYTVTNPGSPVGTAHTAVRLATTGALAANAPSGNVLTGTAPGPIPDIDGVPPAVNDRVLVQDEANAAHNGIYTVTTLGTGTTATPSGGAVRVATTVSLAGARSTNVITASANGSLGQIDGVTLAVGDRILLKNQGGGASSKDNGIYTVTNLGSGSTKWTLTRATDATGTQLTVGMNVSVTNGTVNGGQAFYITTPASGSISVNSSAIGFTQSVNWSLTRATDADTTGELNPNDEVPVTAGTANAGLTFYISAPTVGPITINTTSITFSQFSKWVLTRATDADTTGEVVYGDQVPVTNGVTYAGAAFYVSAPSGTITINTTAITFAQSTRWLLTRATDTILGGDQVPVTSGTINANTTYYVSTPASGAVVLGVTALGFSQSSKWVLTRASDAATTGQLNVGDLVPVTSGLLSSGLTYYVSLPASGTITLNSTPIGFSTSSKWVLTRASDANTTGQLVGGDQVPVTNGATNGGKTFYVSTPTTGGSIIFNVTAIAFSPSSKWSFTRATDADTTGELNPGDLVPVTSGTANGNKTFYVSTPASGTITINSTAIGFSQSSKWVLTRATDANTSAQVFPGLQVPVSGGATNGGKTFYISSPASGTITLNSTSIVFSQASPWVLTRKSPYDAAGGGLVPGLLVSVSGGSANGGKTYYLSSPMSGTISVNATGIAFAVGTSWQLTRTTDADTTGEITPGMEVSVANGASNAGRVFSVSSPTSGAITINTTAIGFTYGLPSMMAPIISPDGKKIAYVNGDADVDGGFAETGWRRGLTMLNFDQGTMTLSNKKRLLNNWNSTTAGMPVKWPFFEGDSRSLLYVETDPNEFCSSDANAGKCNSVPTDTYSAAVCTGTASSQLVDTNLERACFNAAYGSMSPTTRGFWPGRIYSIDTAATTPSTTRVELSHLDDAEDTADADKAYQPTVLPFTAGGKRWVIFTSPRSYGNQFNQRGSGGSGTPTDLSCAASMLWVAALDDATANGTDRSHPAFFMPGQQVLKITASPHYVNERGYLVPSPCKSAGTSCSVDEECCGSSASPATAACRAPVGWDPSTGAPAKTCEALSGTCGNAGQSCSTGADCCNGASCINFVCSGGGHYTAATFTREYVAMCPSGQLPVWQLYSFHLTTGGDSQLVFSAQTSNDLSTLDAATVVPLGSSTDDTVSPNPPDTIDVGAKLDAAGISKNLVNLRILVKLVPSTDSLTAPTLVDWQMRYTCQDSL